MPCRSAEAPGKTPNLILASLVVATAIGLDRFPEFTSDLLAHVMSGDQLHAGHNMGGTR